MFPTFDKEEFLVQQHQYPSFPFNTDNTPLPVSDPEVFLFVLGAF